MWRSAIRRYPTWAVRGMAFAWRRPCCLRHRRESHVLEMGEDLQGLAGYCLAGNRRPRFTTHLEARGIRSQYALCADALRLSTFALAADFFRGETPRDAVVCRESPQIAAAKILWGQTPPGITVCGPIWHYRCRFALNRDPDVPTSLRFGDGYRRTDQPADNPNRGLSPHRMGTSQGDCLVCYCSSPGTGMTFGVERLPHVGV